MGPTIRRATIDDLQGMVDLLLQDAERRTALDPVLWAVAPDAKSRVVTVVRTGLKGPKGSPPELWMIAETAGRIVGIAHAMLVPVPPIYGVKTGPPGLFLDDCFTSHDAPHGTAEALLEATEVSLRDMGASTLIASCPSAGPWRPLYEGHGYEPLTLYMAKHGFRAHVPASGVRPAEAGDISGIVRLSADHRKTLSVLNPRFWPIHPDADNRFEGWMRYSLTLTDRNMLVASAPDGIHGYIIAQPVSGQHLPAAHDIRSIGMIDDFYDRDFADTQSISDSGKTTAELLSAAESAFARGSYTAALAVCPAAWTSKVSLLKRQGYRTAKLWMLKR